MATLIWTEPAVADLEEIGQFISKDNPPAAEKVGSKIIREAENIAAFPRLGRIVPEFGNPQIREIISQSYRVIYKFDEEGDLVAILRIWHWARGMLQLADDSRPLIARETLFSSAMRPTRDPSFYVFMRDHSALVQSF